MKINFWTIIILLLTHLCHGQTLKVEGVVYRMNSSEGLPYVSIGVKGSVKGTVTDLSGKFSLQVAPSDSLVFSFVGLKSKVISVAEFKSPVFLEDEIIELPEAVVHSKTQDRAVFGNTKSKTSILFGGSNQYAILIKNKEESQYTLEELYFYVQPDIEKQNVFKTAIKIRVYKNENNVPGSDLLSEDIVIAINKKEKKIIVDVANYGIAVPPEGLFIGIDLLGFFDAKNSFIPYNRTTTPLNLRIQFSEGESYITYSKFFGTAWTRVAARDRHGNPIKVSAKFGAKVSY